MKTILCLTDFSSTANHAALYGYEMAKKLKAGLIFCNVVNIPAEITQYEVIMWPLKEFEHIEEDNTEVLKKLGKVFQQQDDSDGFHPAIKYSCESGTVTEVISNMQRIKKPDMIVMGTHSGGLMKHLIFGNHVRELIDAATVPLLLVPPKVKHAKISWIGFATNLSPEDLSFACKIAQLSGYMNAELVIMYVGQENHENEESIKKRMALFNTLLKEKCNYPKLSFQYANEDSVTAGLQKLCIKNRNHGILSIVHRNNSYLNEILQGSYTQKMAKQLPVPLLVLPKNYTSIN